MGSGSGSVEDFKDIVLVDPKDSTRTVTTNDLFIGRSALVVFLRDLTSCWSKKLASTISRESSTIRETYGLKMIAITLCGEDVETFLRENWTGGEVWVDREKKAFACFGRGKIRKAGFVQVFLPRWWMHFFKCKDPKCKKDLQTVLDGAEVMGPSSVVYVFREKLPGDKINMEELMAACCKASGDKNRGKNETSSPESVENETRSVKSRQSRKTQRSREAKNTNDGRL